MAVLIWTEPALAELRALHAFIARDSGRYADRVVDRIVETVDRLTAFPASGRRVPESNDPALREVIAGAHRVIYRHVPGEPEQVFILAVVHGRQQLPPRLTQN